jgi:ABC-type multidrug transport system permease subunit
MPEQEKSAGSAAGDGQGSQRVTHPAWVELTLARMREFLREKGAVFWAFGFPVLLSLGLGLAFRERPPALPRVAQLGSAPWLSEALDALAAAGKLELVAASAEQVARGLRIGSIDLAVAGSPSTSPAGDSGEPVVAEGDQSGAGATVLDPQVLSAGRTLEYSFDPDREEARRARLAVDDALQRGFGRQDLFEAEDLPYSSRTRYIDFLFPGMIGMTLMGSCMWGLGYNIVLMRKRRQLKRLAATPMRRSTFLLGMFLSRAIFLTLEVIFLLLIARFMFAIRIEGQVELAFLIALLGAAAFSGIAVLIAGRVESLEAANGWINLVTLPMWIFSGLFFSYERFPEFLHRPLSLLPLSALNDGLRAVINEGRGFFELWPEASILSVWALVTFALASRRFRWQ